MGPTSPERRTFLRWAIKGMGALVTVVLGVPAGAYLIDPRNRPIPEKDFRTVDGVRIDELVRDVPRQGVIRDVRRDAWTLHPHDVVGRVWVIKEGPAERDLKIFTTVCPHLGCAINLTPPSGFTCPCHGARFDIKGDRIIEDGHQNPAPRGMDPLEWQIHPDDPQVLQVKYVSYYQSRATRDIQG